MKRVSKILAVVMVVAMLFSMVIIPTTAADLDNATLKLSYKDISGKEIYSAKAGDIIDLYVSLKTDAYVQSMQFYVNYNSDYVKHLPQNATTTDKTPVAFNACQWVGNFNDSSKVTITDAELSAADEYGMGYYYNWGSATKSCTPYNASTMPAPALATTKLVKFVYAAKMDDQALLVNTKGEFCEMARVRFAVVKDVDFTSDIFFFDNDLEKVIVNIDSGNVAFSVLAINAAKDLNVSFEYAAAPAEKEVKHADTMAQWADKDAGLINVGLVGKFSAEDIAIKFSDGTDGKIAGQSTNVTAVGAKVTINGTTKDKTTNYVYDVNGDGSEFWFRAVVENVPYNAVEAAGEISVVYYVVIDGETYESDAYTTTVAEVYAEATDNGMPAFGA